MTDEIRRPKRLVDQSSAAVRHYLETKRTIIVPFGATEQHGPGLPVGTDAAIARALGDAVSAQTGVLVAPTLPVGVSAFHIRYSGTISLRPETYIPLTKDILWGLVQQGFTRLFLINAHFENSGILRATAEQLLAELTNTVMMLRDFWDMPNAKQIAARYFEEPGGHADAADAALMLKIAFEDVQPELFTEEWPKVNAMVSPDLHAAFLTTSGVIGSNQKRASTLAGIEYFEAIVGDMVRDVETLKALTTPSDSKESAARSHKPLEATGARP